MGCRGGGYTVEKVMMKEHDRQRMRHSAIPPGGASLSSTSPMTSSEEGHTMDPWNTNAEKDRSEWNKRNALTLVV